jgi:hypothetical protein
MRESRTYGSGRGACDETHVPTATNDGCQEHELKNESVAVLEHPEMNVARVWMRAVEGCDLGQRGHT